VPLPPSPFVYPILDVALLSGRDPGSIARSLVVAGARILQVRGKDLAVGALCDVVAAVVAATRGTGALVIVNDRPDIALLTGADGVHVGQDDMPAADVRRLMPRPLIVGLSTHGAAQLARAPFEALDYVAIGPVSSTASKEKADPVVGLEGVRMARAVTALPLVAIGGITRDNAAAVVAAGADGLAVIAAIMSGAEPGEAYRALAGAFRAFPPRR
jgi:thiamine-phosphate pyrophosphorylase